MEESWRLSSLFEVEHKKIKLNQWTKRRTRIAYVALFAIVLPLCFYFGFQPVSSVEASNYPILNIPTIGLSTPVLKLTIQDRQLIAPDDIAGSYSQAENKLFIIGHSSTVFQKLDMLKIYDQFTYESKTYQVTNLAILEKANIDMREILAPADQETIVIMTCAGTPLANQDATHRLIVTATAIN